jgi:hypothetical protein
MGDAHARQGDGEITSQGPQAPMHAEFTVELIRDRYMKRPWAENNDSIMVKGINGSLTTATQAGTHVLSRQLVTGLRPESLRTSTRACKHRAVRFCRWRRPHAHAAAKIRRDVLSQLPKLKKKPRPKPMSRGGEIGSSRALRLLGGLRYRCDVYRLGNTCYSVYGCGDAHGALYSFTGRIVLSQLTFMRDDARAAAVNN